MADVMVIDVDELNPRDLVQMGSSDLPKKSLKQKRPSQSPLMKPATISDDENEAKIEGLNKEMANMADVTVIDVDELTPKDTVQISGSDLPKKSLKRKRPSQSPSMKPATISDEEKEAKIEHLNQEIDGLYKYFKEISGKKIEMDWNDGKTNLNAVIACLLEESELPLTKLVEEIYEKVQGRNGVSTTMALVKSSVLLVGQRSAYGVSNLDADVLEDDTDSCLWCWETRDLKLMPKSARGILKIRRTCRKKINERIAVVSAMIAALRNSEGSPNYNNEIKKATEKLFKVLSEPDIRVLVDSLVAKNCVERNGKEAMREEKLLLKQLEKEKREAEKEKKRMEREHEKEKCQNEKELKRLQEEAEKEEKRREREEAEMKKQLKKQQEEAEKERWRREKEEAELKKKRAVEKQASIMERFLKKKQSMSPCLDDKSSKKAVTSESTSAASDKFHEAVTVSMDCALSQNYEICIDDIRKSHFTNWKNLGQMIRSNRNQNWGIRRKPKTALITELKLTNTEGVAHDDGMNAGRLDVCEETVSDERPFEITVDSSVPSSQKTYHRKQLLQFDKSHRPAFYGIWPKKSNVVTPHHPLRKDPDLDYDIDSDEEWEEEDPGESLSDCEKDNEEECLEDESMKAEDDSEDGFFVPDGYLSDNEGVQVDRMESEQVDMDGEAISSTSCKLQIESEELCLMFKQQKYLHNLTELALRKNQPLIISNLMHEKATSLMAEDLTGTEKLEQTCLLALCVRLFPGGPLIEVSVHDDVNEEDQEPCLSMDSSTPLVAVSSLLDADLPKIVHAVQSCSQGINKVVDCLQQSFPSIPKTHLRNKVREISDFLDNRWQVKKEILDKLGISVSPAKSSRTRGIATFFSKRCMPPSSCKSMNPTETSPNPSNKQSASQPDCT